MSAAALPPDHLQPQSADGLGTGATMALVAHAALVAALALGVDWRSNAEVVHSAELWSALPQVAAPRAPTPAPSPPPPPAPARAPAPAPAPPPPAPTRSAVEIAIEKEKIAKAERELERARQREADARRALEAEQAALKQQRELQRKRTEEAARKAAAAKEAARQQALLDKQRQENLDRMLAQAGTGNPNSGGTAARDSGPSASYGGKLISHIRSNIVMADLDRLPPSLEAEVEVHATASGTVLSRRLIKPSGNATWDEAVLRAIDRSGTLPRDTDGRVPTSIRIKFRPQE